MLTGGAEGGKRKERIGSEGANVKKLLEKTTQLQVHEKPDWARVEAF